MFRTSVRAVVAMVFVLGFCAVSVQAEEASTLEPLPFLTVGCPEVGTTPAPPEPLPRLDLQTLSPAAPECRGCSVHNCYYQLVGARCLASGAPGRCTVSHWCPEIRETSCTCEPV